MINEETNPPDEITVYLTEPPHLEGEYTIKFRGWQPPEPDVGITRGYWEELWVDDDSIDDVTGDILVTKNVELIYDKINEYMAAQYQP